MSGAVDVDFSEAVHLAVNGQSGKLCELLRGDIALGPNEREYLARLVERCAELARSDYGTPPGRREIAAGSPQVRRVVELYEGHLANGMQKSQAKAEVAAKCEICVRTVENYLKKERERQHAVGHARDKIKALQGKSQTT